MADWDTCARQLEQRALANLPPLRDILGGDFVSDQLGHREQRRLLSLARPGVAELRAVTDRLHALTHEPWHPSDSSWRTGQRELLDRINWWNRVFLAAHVDDRESPALLVELIGSAPVQLNACVDKLLAAHHASAALKSRAHGEVEVFCPEKLLDQIVTHLLENIDKHRAPYANAPVPAGGRIPAARPGYGADGGPQLRDQAERPGSGRGCGRWTRSSSRSAGR